MAAYERIEAEPGVLLVPGMEVKTDRGDMIGLFLAEEIRSRIFAEVVDEIRGQGGIAVLPHPYRRSCDPADLVGAVDLVEVINARSKDVENQRASILAKSAGKPSIGGSDAHATHEIGAAGTALMTEGSSLEDIRRALLAGNRVCYGISSPILLSHGYTYVAARMKRVLGGAIR
jgi:predicted metal-dependent phosphoesterase TrpH